MQGITVNDKSFEGEKFRSLLGSSGMWGKVSRFFSITTFCLHTFMHGFPTLQNSNERFNESFAFLTWILLKTVISMDESTLLTHVCADFTLSRMIMQTLEKLKWVRDETDPRTLTASLLASSASYFLISWQKPSRFFAMHYCGTFPQIFQNFS